MPHKYAVSRIRLTLQRPRRQDVLVHVVEVIGEEEVLRGRRSQAEEGRVQVEGGSQRSQTRVIDHTETRQRLDLLPAVELLPQGRRHLGQGLSGDWEGWGGVRAGYETRNLCVVMEASSKRKLRQNLHYPTVRVRETFLTLPNELPGANLLLSIVFVCNCAAC